VGRCAATFPRSPTKPPVSQPTLVDHRDGTAEVCRRPRVVKPAIIVRTQAERRGLIQAHISLIEYILVQELAHLGHRSHDRMFWDSVGQRLPVYDQRRVRRRELGPSLVG
jgi:hypothetical protein